MSYFYRIHHLDLYRIETVADPSSTPDLPSRQALGLTSLQLPRVFREDVSIIEWPDRLHYTSAMPSQYVRVYIQDSGGSNDGLCEDGDRVIELSRVGGVDDSLVLSPVLLSQISEMSDRDDEYIESE